MLVFVVAMVVLVAVGVLLWKTMAAQVARAADTGRDASEAPTGPTRTVRPAAGRARPPAPDDDPEFLRHLDERIRRPEREDPPSP